MGTSRDRVRKAFNNFYSQDMLFDLFKVYFKKWIADGYIGLNLGLFEVSLLTKSSPKIKFLDLLEQCFIKEENFLNIFNSLPKDIQDIFVNIAWNGKHCIDHKERDKFLRQGQKFSSVVDLREEYSFFKYAEDLKKNEYLYLDNDIVRWYRRFLPKHKDCAIHPIGSINGAMISNNEESIVENLRYYLKFFADGKLGLSSSGKLLKSSKLGMKKFCNIDEYYHDLNDLDFLKTETLGLFFYLLKDEYLTRDYLKGNNLKNIITDLLDGTNIKDDGSAYARLYLNYLKGYSSSGKNNMELSRAFHTIKNILTNIPSKKSIGVNNIINYIIYNDKFIEILEFERVMGNVYINEANYERTKLTNYDNYRSYIIEPFIKSVLFLLSTLGVLEIQYIIPCGKKSLYLRHGYLSKYDGIQAIKLTKLGEYIFDKTSHYEFHIEEEGSVFLEEDRLLVGIIGEAPVRALFLEEIGIKISPNKYKITPESFLRKINNKKLLEEKIEEFRSKISKTPGGIWEDLFLELLSRMSSITVLNNYSTLKLKEDKNLISFITKDEKVSKMILKAENYHIIIENNKLKEFEEILNENGYFLV